MHTPQPGQDQTMAFVKPRRACLILSPALRIGISIISAGMCMYRVKGSTHMKTPRAIE